METKNTILSSAAYEDPNYWSRRATPDGVATLGWSRALNDYYYSIKERYVKHFLKTVPECGWVLEVGCGVGRIGTYIHKMRPDINLVGVDFSDKMLLVASEAGIYTHLVRANITNLPFIQGKYNLVFAMDVLFHVVRPSRKGCAWEELSRVAKAEEAVAAYGTGYEITSLVVIERLVKVLLPFSWISQNFRDLLILWLAARCDNSN